MSSNRLWQAGFFRGDSYVCSAKRSGDNSDYKKNLGSHFRLFPDSRKITESYVKTMGWALARAAKQTGKPVPGYTIDFGDRLQAVISRIGTLERAASASGASVDQLTSWKFGRSRPDFFALQRLCDAAGESIGWLASGDEPRDSHEELRHVIGTHQEHGGVPVHHVAALETAPQAGFVSVPMLDVQLSAGAGAVAVSEDVQAYLAMEAAFLRSLGINPAGARIVDVTGDSMFPTLRDRDRVVVDTMIDHIADEGLYAVVLGNSLLIKRVQISLDGSVTLRSDNREAGYKDIPVALADLPDLRVIGRVRIRIHLM